MNVPHIIRMTNGMKLDFPGIDSDSLDSMFDISDDVFRPNVTNLVHFMSSSLHEGEGVDFSDEEISITHDNMFETIVTIKRFGQHDSIEFDYDDFSLWGLQKNETSEKNDSHRQENQRSKAFHHKNNDYDGTERMSPTFQKQRNTPCQRANKENVREMQKDFKIMDDTNDDTVKATKRRNKTSQRRTSRRSHYSTTESRPDRKSTIASKGPSEKMLSNDDDTNLPSSSEHSLHTTDTTMVKLEDDEDIIPSESSHSLLNKIECNTKSTLDSTSSHSVPTVVMTTSIRTKKKKNGTNPRHQHHLRR